MSTALVEPEVNAVLAKSQKLHTDGMAAIAAGGEQIKRFTGYAPGVAKRFMAALLFDQSRSLMAETTGLFFMDDFAVFAKAKGIDLLLAGRDFPVHITVGEGEVADTGDFYKFPLFAGTMPDGHNVVLSELVMQGTNLLLTASSIPEWFQALRDGVNDNYRDSKMVAVKPIPIENLMHMTLARVKSGNDAQVQEFAKFVDQLRGVIRSGPIVLKVRTLYQGVSLEFLNGCIR
jgi:hypothetical protein